MHLDGWTIALQTVNFAVLVWLLRRFLYQPVLHVIDARKAEVQRQYDSAKASEDQANARLAEIAAERAGIAAEREAALEGAAIQAQQTIEHGRQQGERDTKALLDAARKTLATEREQAFAEARSMAVDLGADFARRLLAELPMHVRADLWIERIERHLRSLPEAQVGTLTRQLADGTALRVRTASTLPPAAIESWQERLRQTFGAVNVMFDADEELIAGAELHFPTAILRFSWQSELARLRAEVEADADAR